MAEAEPSNRLLLMPDICLNAIINLLKGRPGAARTRFFISPPSESGETRPAELRTPNRPRAFATDPRDRSP